MAFLRLSGLSPLSPIPSVYFSRSAFEYHPANRLNGFDQPTVWHEFTGLANSLKAMNLGQGFPDFAPPNFIKNAIQKAIQEKNLNMYARSAGHLPLCVKLAEKYSEKFKRKVDPMTNVLVAAGATETLYSVMQGLLQQGDEIIVFEPAFDIYSAQAAMANASIVSVPLFVKEGAWEFDRKTFEKAFTPKTKMLIINTPHNPTGKVFNREELEYIAHVVHKYPNCVVVTDEVYDNLLFDDNEHVHFASFPHMWDRTLTISSAGKTFSVTGWKIGWVCGPEHLVKPAALAHQWVTFSISTPMQEAVKDALEDSLLPFGGFETYYHWLSAEYVRKRDILSKALISAGIIPVAPQGSFFIMGNTSNIKIPSKYLFPEGKDIIPRDYAFCRYLIHEYGVASIPPSAFMCNENKYMVKDYARFAFCKSDEVLLEAANRLKKLKPEK